jgi:hypothetical protein
MVVKKHRETQSGTNRKPPFHKRRRPKHAGYHPTEKQAQKDDHKPLRSPPSMPRAIAASRKKSRRSSPSPQG